MDMKSITTIEAYVESISEQKTISRGKKGLLDKVEITLVMSDKQKLFVEIRNNNISKLITNNIEVASFVSVDMFFQGSEKNGLRYNNLYVKDIKKI